MLCFLLTGCAYEVIHFPTENSPSYASNNASVSSLPASGYHRVESGETLFSIAFRYGLDYRELAALNHIDAPYIIYPKQKIRLGENKANSSQRVADKATNKASKAVNNRPKVAVKSKVTASTKTYKKDTKPLVKVKAWSWPVDGKVVRGFSNTGVSSKGIDIKGTQGALVKAAADGTVVYAGSGLIGYGNLVIVKHNEVYLSAYAYNERILVKEQQNVRAGDSLAVIGGKGNDRPLLHFEVRRDGQPINPQDILPKR
ncbi:peptidoglycan DD-metalloendopeptidase family protein [Marinomonas transparens]|nr:peptidoglycan DD-metalloendopeptidase family protein [Marinomonas transparens]